MHFNVQNIKYLFWFFFFLHNNNYPDTHSYFRSPLKDHVQYVISRTNLLALDVQAVKQLRNVAAQAGEPVVEEHLHTGLADGTLLRRERERERERERKGTRGKTDG